MLDIRLIRENPKEMEERLKRKDPSVSLAELLDIDVKWREINVRADELKNHRNVVSKEIGSMPNGDEKQQKLAEMKAVSQQIKDLDAGLRALEDRQKSLIEALPNPPDDSVPVSQDPDDKITTRAWGDKPAFSFEPKPHTELGVLHKLFDFERAAKLSASQFAMYTGLGALLEWALIHYMIDVHTRENAFQLFLTPYLVNEETMFASGQLPKFREQLYKCADDPLYLIPTSEVPLNNLHRGEILDEAQLPLNYCAYTACFRREAGTYGKEERGLIRVHQFNKVEMFKFTTPETSFDALEQLVAFAEDLVRRLGLHFRTTLLVTSDIAQQSAKTYDVEVWLPGQNRYYEVSSCSNCTDYQARRANIRYRPAEGGKPRFVHTLNGSGLATSRLMVSLLESNQQPDGSIVIPDVLRPSLGGKEVLTP